MATESEPRWSRGALVATSVVLSGGLLLARIPLLTTRRFDPDELEHAHVAYCLTLGMVPFRDFFEHHTPVFHYLLAGLFSFFDMGAPAAAMQALFTARMLTWGISVLVALQTFRLARQLRDSTTAWVALPIVCGSIVLALRALEIRPDGLSTLLWLLSIGWLHQGFVQSAPSSPAARRAFVLSGLAIGFAVLTSQKLLLAGPAIAVLLAWYLVSPRFGGSGTSRLANVTLQGTAVALTWALAVAWFAKDQAAAEFVRLTLFDNLQWKSESTARTILSFVMRYEPWLFALTAGGAGLVVRDLARREGVAASHVILLVTASGLFAGLFVVPVPYAQYCLTFLPGFAILAATFLTASARALSSSGVRAEPDRVVWTAAVLAAVVVLSVLGLWLSQPVVVSGAIYPAIVCSAVAILAVAARRRLVGLGLAMVITALTVLPAQWGAWMLALGDGGQFAAMRTVLSAATRDDLVLDGWTGYGALRRHATYYWMLHPGVRAMLDDSVATALVEEVTSGRVTPKVVVLDTNLRAFSADLAAFVQQHYDDTGDGIIFVRSSK